MDRIDYEHKVIEILDEVFSNLPSVEYELFLKSMERILEEYKN